MHITVSRNEFASAFAWPCGGLPKHAVVPVLSGIRLAVEDSTLTLSVFDYEQSRRVRLHGDDAQAGQVLVDGAELKKVVRSLPRGDRAAIDISADGAALALAAQGCTWTLPALPRTRTTRSCRTCPG